VDELICPVCKHKFFVEEYSSGECPNCKKAYYFWDDGWNYEQEENNGWEGFFWELKKV